MERAATVRMAEAPGRVNLIGDHTDYNGLPVFPMALQRRFRMIFRPRPTRRSGLLRVDGYENGSFEIASEIEPYEQGDWGNYVKASARILAQRFGPLRGMDMLLHSDIPVAAGLEFLVGAGGGQRDRAAGRQRDRSAGSKNWWNCFPEGERSVGTRGGAMDHTVCLAGTEQARPQDRFLAVCGPSHAGSGRMALPDRPQPGARGKVARGEGALQRAPGILPQGVSAAAASVLGDRGTPVPPRNQRGGASGAGPGRDVRRRDREFRSGS